MLPTQCSKALNIQVRCHRAGRNHSGFVPFRTERMNCTPSACNTRCNIMPDAQCSTGTQEARTPASNYAGGLPTSVAIHSLRSQSTLLLLLLLLQSCLHDSSPALQYNISTMQNNKHKPAAPACPPTPVPIPCSPRAQGTSISWWHTYIPQVTTHRAQLLIRYVPRQYCLGCLLRVKTPSSIAQATSY